MIMPERQKYPIGQQDFKGLRESGCVYIDKTQFIRQIVGSGHQYFFLARPRRFGKSLFLSTLKWFFLGERDLFHGLAIDSHDWNWDRYPVLHLDFNTDRYETPEDFDHILEYLLHQWEKEYDISTPSPSFAVRFKAVIEKAHEITGHKVVILVDEYDEPLVTNLDDMERFERLRVKLASVYANFKSGAEHIRLVFLTGVSRFSKLSVFSDLNNLQDITFNGEYADICGITSDELLHYLSPGIYDLAKKRHLSYHEACEKMRRNYDGYRFAEDGSDIYNPWSVLNCLAVSKLGNYWNETGMPTILAEALKRINADLKEYLDTYCTEEDLKGLDLLNPDPTALMYQTGYLTIKEFHPELDRIRLGVPNKEVEAGLYGVLLPYYVQVRRNGFNAAKKVLTDIVTYFQLGRPEKSMENLRVFFAGIDYGLKMDDENNFHNALFLLTHLIGLETKAEFHTSDGRIDILIETNEYIYIIELKYDHSAEEALRQIDEKEYTLRFRDDGRRIYRIGASFSSRTRRIDNWIIATD